MIFTDKTYSILKWIAKILLPALGTLYLALAEIWNLPLGQEVSGTIMALVLFLGIVLEISTANYAKTLATMNMTLANPMPKVDDATLIRMMILGTRLDDVVQKGVNKTPVE